MTKPDDIPQDAWDAAREAMNAHYHVTSARNQSEWDAYIYVAARAVLVERERCAQIADDHAKAWGLAMGTGATEIAKAIRGAP